MTDLISILQQPDVRPIRLFPLTEPAHWVSILDAKGQEIVCIEDPTKLDASERAALDAALAKRHFVPVIRRVLTITRAPDGFDWLVETDRGTTTFRIETDESIQSLGGGRLVIIDKLGTRYLVPKITDLDRDSRRKLERYY
ncbi:MAG: DUF1854 domain-containing protein [Verrucomicrobia bacterium]|nr:DUF1854 domain-containing protein [Verrucomicrobiota bacterium]